MGKDISTVFGTLHFIVYGRKIQLGWTKLDLNRVYYLFIIIYLFSGEQNRWLEQLEISHGNFDDQYLTLVQISG